MSIEDRIDSLNPSIATVAAWASRWPNGSNGTRGFGEAYSINGNIQNFNRSLNGLHVVDGGKTIAANSLQGTRELNTQLKARGIGHRVIAGAFEPVVIVPVMKPRNVTTRTLFGTKTVSELHEVKEYKPYRPSLGELTNQDNLTPASIIGVNLVQNDHYFDDSGRPGRSIMAGIITDERNVNLLQESLLENPLLLRRFTSHIFRNIIGISPTDLPDPDYDAIDRIAPVTQFVERSNDGPNDGITVPTVSR